MTKITITQADLNAAEEMLIDLCAPMMPLVANDAALHFARHHAAGAAAERAKIVAFIRGKLLEDYDERTAKETEAWWMADQIEAGKHLKGGGDE